MSLWKKIKELFKRLKAKYLPEHSWRFANCEAFDKLAADASL